jgi:thiol-disulfide isomerase/thioredoxin
MSTLVHRVRRMFRILPLAAALTGTASAQSNFTDCEPNEFLSGKLERAIAAASNPVLAFDERMAAFRKLLEENPTNLFVNRPYLAQFNSYSKQTLYDRWLPHYDSLYREKPSDPARAYLYALSIVRRDPAKSAALLESLTREVPDGPWPFLTLSWIKSRVKPFDSTGASAALDRFVALCPATLDSDALARIVASGSDALKRSTAERLRKQLPEKTDLHSVATWPVLWQIEFQIEPPSQQEAVRTRIRQDLTQLRAMKSGPDDIRLDTLNQGYALVNDGEGRRSARDELARTQPLSRAAAEAALDRWTEENPPPNGPEEASRFARRQLEASDVWIALWPNFGPAWRERWQGMLSAALEPAKTATIGKQILAFSQSNPDYTFGSTLPPTLAIAGRFVNDKVELAAIPELLSRCLREHQERIESELATSPKLSPLDERTIIAGARSWRLRLRGVAIQFYTSTGKPDQARAELESYRKEAAELDPAGGNPFWIGLTGLVDASIALGRKDAAREALARMDSALPQHNGSQPVKIQQAEHESLYWNAKAKFAEADGRKPDAVAYYLRAASALLDYSSARRISLAEKAGQLWASIGGSSDGLQMLSPDANQAAASAWKPIGQPMPDFSLEDATGRAVRLADLAGKTIFINVWATWCGPCQTELPSVQRIYEALKEQPDVAVLTFNIDDNPGVVDSYMKQRGFSFPVVLAREYVEGRMNVEGIPRNWIVDSKGVLRLERQMGEGEAFVKDVTLAIGQIRKSGKP